MVTPCRLFDLFCSAACVQTFRQRHHVSLAAAPRIFGKASAAEMFADWDGYCPICDRQVAYQPCDVHTFAVFTLADAEAEELGYLGFGSRVVHEGRGPSKYVVVGMQAEYADWQCGRLWSGLRGGASRWDSFQAAREAADRH